MAEETSQRKDRKAVGRKRIRKGTVMAHKFLDAVQLSGGNRIVDLERFRVGHTAPPYPARIIYWVGSSKEEGFLATRTPLGMARPARIQRKNDGAESQCQRRQGSVVQQISTTKRSCMGKRNQRTVAGRPAMAKRSRAALMFAGQEFR